MSQANNRGPACLEEVFIKNSPSSKQQSIEAIYKKYGKCEYIKYSASVGNNDMHAFNNNGLITWFNVSRCKIASYFEMVSHG
jgi:hypothetical protein